MSEKEKKGINSIQLGRLDLYYPLKFETKHSYEKLCSSICQSVDRDISMHLRDIHRTTEHILEKAKDEAYTEVLGKLPLERSVSKWFRKRKESDNQKVNGLGINTKIELLTTDQSVKISLKPGEVESYTERYDELQEELKRYKEIYGKKFVTYQDRIVLLPLHIQLSNDKWVWLNAMLYIFANKMGVLKFELTLEDVPITPLVDNNADSYIKCIKDVWTGLSVSQETFWGICDAYVKRISYLSKTKILALNNALYNIILAKFDGMPSRVDRIQPEIMQDLYKIIAAPIQERGETSIREEAREYIKKQSVGFNGVKYITNTAGGCLSIIDAETIEWEKDNYKKRKNLKTLETDDVKTIYKGIVRNLSADVEMALLIPLLKKINESYIYSQKLMKTKDMHGLQAKYKKNVMFISEIQENCYGTVSEQIEAFERMMPYYLKEKIIRDKMEAVDYILEDQEAQKNSLFQNFIAIGGLIMTLVFGLPAIHETLTLIKKICGMASVDIPRISVDGVSMAIWILLMGGLCLFLLLKSKGDRGIELE